MKRISGALHTLGGRFKGYLILNIELSADSEDRSEKQILISSEWQADANPKKKE
jgi:hypothetical protein